LHEVEVPTELAREWTVENDFLDAVKAGDDERPYPTFEDGLRYMRVVQAVADSVLVTSGSRSRRKLFGASDRRFKPWRPPDLNKLRLQTAAPLRHVIALRKATEDHLSRSITFRALPPQQIKGVDAPVEVLRSRIELNRIRLA